MFPSIASSFIKLYCREVDCFYMIRSLWLLSQLSRLNSDSISQKKLKEEAPGAMRHLMILVQTSDHSCEYSGVLYMNAFLTVNFCWLNC